MPNILGIPETQTCETANIAIVNPTLLPEPDAAPFAAADWDALQPSAERQGLNPAVYDGLGLTAGEREAVQEGVTALATNRKRRARSATAA